MCSTMKMLADLNLLIKLKLCFKFQNHFLQQNCTTTVLWCCIFCMKKAVVLASIALYQ